MLALVAEQVEWVEWVEQALAPALVEVVAQTVVAAACLCLVPLFSINY